MTDLREQIAQAFHEATKDNLVEFQSFETGYETGWQAARATAEQNKTVPVLWQYRTKTGGEWEVSYGKPDHMSDCDYEKRALYVTAQQDAAIESKAAESTYPDELTPELREVLGWPNFKCGPFAHLMVAAGAEIKPKAEDEQAAVLHWLIKLVLKHGDKWNEAATSDLRAMRDRVPAIESQRSGDGS